MDRITVIVAGAFGKMGQQVCAMIDDEDEFQLVAIVDPKGRTRGSVPVFHNVEESLQHIQADVLIDFTTPDVVYHNVTTALEYGVRPVVGTTGMSESQIEQIAQLCKEKSIGAIIAPNFAIGAVLMMKFASIAAKYMPHVEIIEYHHDQKLDAPSGTATKTAEMIAAERVKLQQGHLDEKELIQGSRGGKYEGFRIHSVRLPGLVAHQEVIFGGQGQMLTLRHDAMNRTSFMPGVQMAVKQVVHLNQLIYGLEHLIE